MTKRKLRKLYDKKLRKEFDDYRTQLEQLKKEEIIACAYTIYIVHRIYEYLLEIQDDLTKDMIKMIVSKDDIIFILYWHWVKLDTNDDKELHECIESTLAEICKKKGELK